MTGHKQSAEQKECWVDTQFVFDVIQSENQEKSWTLLILINKYVVPIKLDTNSDVNILDYNDFQAWNSN